MAVSDRWHRSRASSPDEQRCAEHGKYPTPRHGIGKRWLARWWDPEGHQQRESFDRKADAEARLTNVSHDKRRGAYIDPKAGEVTFKKYATEWLASQTYDANTRQSMEIRFRLHAFPVLGSKPIASIKPSTIRTWLRTLEPLSANYRRTIFVNVASVFAAAVDDEILGKNPCRAASITQPAVERKKVIPWEFERVCAVRDGLPERYQITATLAYALGLRQGEVFGLSPDDVDFLRGHVTVQRQVKIVHSQLVFDLPKFEKTRQVPLPPSMRDALAAYLSTRPAREVTLPWDEPDGKPTTARLVVTSREGKALNRNYYNSHLWKPALVIAGIIPEPEINRQFDPSREHGMHALRHFYASTLLDAGESIKAVAEYLGHEDPGFTLRTYTHLMKSSESRVRDAIDALSDQTSAGGLSAPAPKRPPEAL